MVELSNSAASVSYPPTNSCTATSSLLISCSKSSPKSAARRTSSCSGGDRSRPATLLPRFCFPRATRTF